MEVSNRKHINSLLESLHDWQSDEGITDISMLTVALEALVLSNMDIAMQQNLTARAIISLTKLIEDIDCNTIPKVS